MLVCTSVVVVTVKAGRRARGRHVSAGGGRRAGAAGWPRALGLRQEVQHHRRLSALADRRAARPTRSHHLWGPHYCS